MKSLASVGNLPSFSSSPNAVSIAIEDFDAPLNLSMKPADSSKTGSNNDFNSSSGGCITGSGNNLSSGATGTSSSLQSLSSITAALGSGSSSGSGGSDRSQPPYKEGRPRNLGRGVSKPKKNTVASLLAQSRAVGLKPMLATQQLLQQGADFVSSKFANIF